MSSVLVTGANRGIGLEIVKRFQQRGDRVFAAVRSASGDLTGLGVHKVIEGVDVSTKDGVNKLVQSVDGSKLDIVVNNAGILRRDNLEELDFDVISNEFEVNAVGPLRVTKALVDAGNINDGAKLIFMSSRVGSVEDNGSGKNYGYRMSKIALNMAVKNLSLELAPRNIICGLLHPGMVKTDMTNHNGIPVEEAVDGIMKRIDSYSKDDVGKLQFLHQNGEVLPW
eukprot:gb/GECG01006511.1/.p1 GENE.gb/GECG01006511.1/~~gb/GECG01006511.1/.p1  ORF type:complete len:225 (+),score=34.10 gb/GECG01006511.1/:1-675(+)